MSEKSIALAAGRDASRSRNEEETSLEKGCRRRVTPRCDAYRPALGRVMPFDRLRAGRPLPAPSLSRGSIDPSIRVDFVVAPGIQARGAITASAIDFSDIA